MPVIPRKAVTHAGRFHADDVFSAALLSILCPQIKIERRLSVPQGYDGLAFDLGLGAFDHHQADAPVRENGVPYAAFGLLWRAFGPLLVGPEEALRFDEAFIQPLDLDDNTGCGNQLAGIIAAFNPPWDSDEEADACFDKAVAFARAALEHKLADIHAVQRARAQVERALERSQDGLVELERFSPWKMVLRHSNAYFVLYPSQRGGYNAQCVPYEAEERLKAPFPESWAGKTAGELRALSGISTLCFCHRNRFLISAGTLEDARRACYAALRANGL